MNTIKYLICIDPQHPEIGLRSGSREEFETIIRQNETLPTHQKRKFIHDKITEYGHNDEIFMEAPRPAYRKWKREEKQRARCYEGVENYEFLSLEALITLENEHDGVCIKEQVSDENQIDNEVEDKLFLVDLIRDLQSWNPWAVDLYDYYSTGRKRHCSKPMAKKYKCSTRTVQRRKKSFEHHIKLFVRQYHNECLLNKERIDV